jgi:hypothetical protein
MKTHRKTYSDQEFGQLLFPDKPIGIQDQQNSYSLPALVESGVIQVKRYIEEQAHHG